MAIHFTPAQQKVLDARNHNILVSAAAGSGKTAVLVERIVRLISEGEHPIDIDRLLVVTFTRAAAAQMRERIGNALSTRLREDPGNTHLQRQEVLLHNAQITTIDSFCTFLLRNYFSEIDLDPGFRQIDPVESSILAADVLRDFLEEKYEEKDPAFLRCSEYFCPGTGDGELEKLILALCDKAGSHPSTEAWLLERASDYDVQNEDDLFAAPWMRSLIARASDYLMESESTYAAMREICLQPAGPDAVLGFLEEERRGLFEEVHELREKFGRELPEDTESLRTLWEAIMRAVEWGFPRYPTMRGKKYEHYDDRMKKAVKAMRDSEKAAIVKLRAAIGGCSPEMILAMMESSREPMKTLSEAALEYHARLQDVKREKHMIDFVDLEHFALDILAERREDGAYVPRRTAKALRAHYAEILIDEYQDSNEVQELLLQIISGEDEGRNNRFMVGDIKQSIYRFRLARPEIFMQKYDSYRQDDPETERIELDQNFRSRREVLDCVNAFFMRIMRREIGGVDYNDNVSLKKGAVFPDEDSAAPAEDGVWYADSPYCAEFLMLDTAEQENGSEEKDSADTAPESFEGEFGETADSEEGQDGEAGLAPLAADIAALTDRQKEALLIAGRIRELVGVLPVRDEETGEMRPARYGDIVILLRSTVGWNEDLRAVFEREGIPAYAESRTGYFAAEEIRTVIAMLRVLDNPRQDIPLYSVLRGFFGNFTQDEIAAIRLVSREGLLYDALRIAAGETVTDSSDEADEQDPVEQLAEKQPAENSQAEIYTDTGAEMSAAYAPEADKTDTGEQVSAAYAPEADKTDTGAEMSEAYVPDADNTNVGAQISPRLMVKCADFLKFLRKWRERIQYSPVTEILNGLLEETGFQDYCTALPAGEQRSANLRMFRSQADAFTKTDYTGLFQFLRYIDGLHREEIDYGEANTLDENADVVRIMSIHKSKGLEFPICIVAGLSSEFSFRKFDASGPMLFDSDWGVGIHYYDTVSRVRASTLRREEIAEKIRRDCMGEELRVLYVAMTRAKEKLIMTASKKGIGKKIESWISGLSGFFSRPDSFCLSPFMIAGASCFAEQICEAAIAQVGQEECKLLFFGDPAGGDSDVGEGGLFGQAEDCRRILPFPMNVRVLRTGDLTMQRAAEQLDLSRCDEILRGLENHPLDRQQDPAAAQELASRYFRVYPHEELRDLYAQTSVSELKHRAMQAAMEQMEEGTTESAVEMFPDAVPVPYLPAFIRREISDYEEEDSIEEFNEKSRQEGTSEAFGTGGGIAPATPEQPSEAVGTGGGIAPTTAPAQAGEAAAAGARRGTVFHRALELLEYSGREKILGQGHEGVSAWIDRLVKTGILTDEDAALISVRQMFRFIASPLAGRMEAADKKGLLFREQPFVMGCSADRVGEGLPADETVMVQGIIDAFFIEDGQIVLVDYKTDRVRSAGELRMRYATQLSLYAEALENAYGVPVSRKIIYSTSLGREISL